MPISDWASSKGMLVNSFTANPPLPTALVCFENQDQHGNFYCEIVLTSPFKKRLPPLPSPGTKSLHGWFAAVATVVWRLQFDHPPTPLLLLFSLTLLHSIILFFPRASSTLETLTPSLSSLHLIIPTIHAFVRWVSESVAQEEEELEENGKD